MAKKLKVVSGVADKDGQLVPIGTVLTASEAAEKFDKKAFETLSELNAFETLEETKSDDSKKAAKGKSDDSKKSDK